MEDNSSTLSDLGAYCTLRSEGRKKKHQVHYRSLRVHRKADHNDPTQQNDRVKVPYNQLEESISSENCSQIFVPDQNEPGTSNNCDLINLNDSIRCLESMVPVDEHKPSRKQLSNTLGKSSYLIDGDRHQSLSEFKRLSSYCTLRPDQKRKYLLRKLSLLRKPKSVAAADEANRALRALQRLDAGGDENAIGSFSDPEMVEDCLLELDAYLDEIDRNYMCQNNSNDALHAREAGTMECMISSKDACGNSEQISPISGENIEIGYSDFLRRFSDCDSDCAGGAAMMMANEGDASSVGTQSDDITCTTEMVISNVMGRRHPFRNTISASSESTTFPRTQNGKLKFFYSFVFLFLVIFALFWGQFVSVGNASFLLVGPRTWRFSLRFL